MSDPKSLEPKVSCDWYDAAVPEGDFKALIGGLCEVLKTTPRQTEGKHGYRDAVQLLSTGEGVQESRAFVMDDNPLSPGRVYISANGPAGGPARDFLIREGIAHVVKRYDSAVDLSMSDRSFVRRSNQMIDLCTADRKHHHPQGTVEHGRSIYYNVRRKDALTSKHQKMPEAQVVFYEKGKQKGLADMGDWKRIEMRLRPGKVEQAQAASLLEPAQVWGAFKWTSAMLEIATAGVVQAGPAAYPRFQMSLPEVAEEMRKIRAMKSLQHMASQYGRSYDTLAELCGEDEADRLVLAMLKRQREEQPSPSDMYAALYEPRTRH